MNDKKLHRKKKPSQGRRWEVSTSIVHAQNLDLQARTNIQKDKTGMFVVFFQIEMNL